jgi:F-type H+-transporting ATPase subunit a
VLSIASSIAARRLAVRARPRQLMLEMLIGGVRNLLETVLGERAAEFLPFIGALFIYIASMNLLGLVPGMVAPTSNLNTTASLAIISFVVIHYTGFRESKLGYLKHFVEGVPLRFSLKVTAMLTLLAMLPVAALVLVSHLVATIFLPVTLAMRLYGNVMGEEKVVESLIGLVAHSGARWIPVQLPSMALGVVTAVVQAVIFSMLTAVNLSLVLHKEHEPQEAV